MSARLCISENIFSIYSQTEQTLTQDQLLFSQSLQMFCAEATNGYALCGMTLGRLVGTTLNFRCFTLFSKVFGQTKVAQITARAFAKGIGLFGEGSAFHLAPGFLQTGTLLQPGSLQGSLSSTLTIASCQAITLLGIPPNLILQHMAQNCAILGAHEVSATFGWVEKEQGCFLQRFIRTEISNWQISAGVCLTQVICPNVTYMEASIHLQMKLRTTSFKKDSGIRKGFQKIRKNFQNIFLPELVEGVREYLISQEVKDPEHEKLQFHLFSQREETPVLSGETNRLTEPLQATEQSTINEISRMVELVEGFFTSYLERLARTTNAKLISRTIAEEIALQKTHALDIPPKIEEFAKKHPSARLWRLHKPGDTWWLSDGKLNPFLILKPHDSQFMHDLLNYIRRYCNLDQNENWIGISHYDLDYKYHDFFNQIVIPPILFLTEAPRIFFGENAVRFQVTSKISGEEEMETLADNNSRPLLTSDSPQDLEDHDIKDADSAVQWLHDLTHIILASRLAPEIREDFRKIRYAIKTTLKTLQMNLHKRDRLNIFLDKLLELTLPITSENPHLIFREMSKSPLSNKFLFTLYQQLQLFFPHNHPRRKNIFTWFNTEFPHVSEIIERYIF